MKPSAVLLIDLENFYLSREDYLEELKGPVYDRTRFGEDLEKLLGFARAMTEGLPFTVKRAYANYQAWRLYADKTREFYLRSIPDELMQQGVEPVQVFRLSQGRPGPGGKNAADMRMAMDATALLNGVGNVEHFVLVTGDADFIPVILELKRHGHTVSVIGVTGATNELIQRFVDNFELFEDLIDAEKFANKNGDLAASGEGLGPVGEAIRHLLARTGRVRFKILKPLLPKLLKHAFDPGAFGCETTLDFLRKHATELGVVIRPLASDFEIDLPGAAPPPPIGNGSKAAGKPVPRQPEKPPKQPARQPGKPPAKSPAPQPEPHTPDHYRHLLAGHATGAPALVRVPAVPWSVLVWGCDALVPALTPPTGGSTSSVELLRRLNAAAATAIPAHAKHLRFIYPTLRSGLPVPGADGAFTLPEGTTGADLRRRVLRYIGHVLACRLKDHGVPGAVRPEALAAVFDPGAALEVATAELIAALAHPDLVVHPEPAPPPKPARGAEVHTPAGYLKLLKGGGAKGTENAALKLNPAPWPVVERVCADTIPVLHPASGGGPVPREQLQARLTEAGKDLCLEHYPALARRVVTMLLVSGDLVEVDGALALHPDTGSAQDLRNRILSFALQLLQLRLEERGVTDPIRPQVFAAAVDAGPLTDGLVPEIGPAIDWMYQSPPDVQPVEEPALRTGAEPGPEVSALPVPVSGTQGEAAPRTGSATAAEPEPFAEQLAATAPPGAAESPEPVGPEPGPDSGVLEVGAEKQEGGADDSAVQLVASPRAADQPPAPTPHAGPTADDCAFDGTLQTCATPLAPAEPPTAHLRTETAPAGFTERAGEPDPEPGALPLADITSEAVAAAEAPHRVPLPEPTPEPEETEPIVHTLPGAAQATTELVTPEPEPEPAASSPPEPARSEPAPGPDVDDLVQAVPIAYDWVADGDEFTDEVDLAPEPPAPEHLVSPPPRSAIIYLQRTAATQTPMPGTLPVPVPKIAPPEPGHPQPPSVPPPPSESS
jgi:hypothetical protein